MLELQKERQAKMASMNFEDPPATPPGQAALVERKRVLDGRLVTIHTVGRGPAPAIRIQNKGTTPRLTVGRLVVTIRQDGQVSAGQITQTGPGQSE
jgi:hypothetical protein